MSLSQGLLEEFSKLKLAHWSAMKYESVSCIIYENKSIYYIRYLPI